MSADYLAIYRLSGGVIAEAWTESDNLSGLAQLGHTPSAEPGADLTRSVKAFHDA